MLTWNKPKILQGIFDNWKHDFHHNPTLFWLELIGILGCMFAAATLALTAPNPNLILVYCSYLVGSSTLTITSYMRNNGFWVVLNLFFATVDVVGLVRTLTA